MKFLCLPGWVKVTGLILCTVVLSCQRSGGASSLTASGDDRPKTMVELEGTFTDVYKKIFAIESDNLQNTQILEWPHKGEYYPAFSSFTLGLVDELHKAAQRTIDEIAVFGRIRDLASKYNVTAYLGGLSATRVAYQGALGVRRHHGDHRISPYRVSNSFGELFPFEQSVMEIVVDSSSPSDIQLFTSEVTELLKPIVQVSIMGVGAFEKSRGSLTNSCTQALIPLDTKDWDRLQLGSLPYVLNYGVLNEPGKGGQLLNYEEITEVLACLSLFDLTPTQDFKEKLRASIHNSQTKPEISAKSALLTHGMLWEMRHVYRFRPLLKELSWDKSPMIKAYENLPKSPIQSGILGMIDKKPMDLGLETLKWSMSFDKLNPTKQEKLKFNHAVRESTHLSAATRNPYGLPNTYISRSNQDPQTYSSRENAMFGDGLYAYNSWSKSYGSQSIFLLATPITVFLDSMCRYRHVHGPDGPVEYSILKNASFFYVVDPKPAFDEILEKSFAEGIKGYRKMKVRYMNANWQRDLLIEDFFGGNISRAEKLAWWLYNEDSKLTDKLVLPYFECSDAGCKVLAKFRQFLNHTPKVTASKIKRPILRSKPGIPPKGIVKNMVY